jgi:hypothetical protein
MAVNRSKTRSRAQWLKWYQSGAVPQPTFPAGSLKVEDIAPHHSGPERVHQTLTLGGTLIGFGPEWNLLDPLCVIVVPSTQRYELGQVLPRLPGNAIPVGIFFPET